MEQWEIDLRTADEKDKLEEENKQLTEKNERMESQLEKAADILAENGIIYNTPHAKREWVEGN